MKSRVKKNPNDYPRITFRLEAEVVNRLERLKHHTGLRPSQVIHACLSNYLPVIEERHGMLLSPAAKVDGE